MSCSIISKCGKDSLMFHNPFLIRKEKLVVFNDKLAIIITFFHVLA
jgi:hypothetical protein